MKHLVLIIVMAFLITGCKSESLPGYENFYKEYKEVKGTIAFKIPGALAGFVLKDEDVELEEFIKKMDDVSFFIADDATPSMIEDLQKQMPKKYYKELMVIKDGSSDVVFWVNEKGGIISEIIMTVIDNNSLVAMCLTGEFTPKDARKIAKNINVNQARNYKN